MSSDVMNIQQSKTFVIECWNGSETPGQIYSWITKAGYTFAM